MRTITLIALVMPLLAAAPATQPVRWVLEAGIVESDVPATQPASDADLVGRDERFQSLGAPLLAPGARVVSSMRVLAADREPFSAIATIGERTIRLEGRAVASAGSPSIVRIEFTFEDATGVTSRSTTAITSNIMLTAGQPVAIGGLRVEPGPVSRGIVLTLKPHGR